MTYAAGAGRGGCPGPGAARSALSPSPAQRAARPRRAEGNEGTWQSFISPGGGPALLPALPLVVPNDLKRFRNAAGGTEGLTA